MTSLKTMSRAVLCDRLPLVRTVRPKPDGGEDTSDRIRGAQMVPVFGREVEEGQQPLTVLRHAVEGLGIPGLVFVSEDGRGDLGGRPIRGIADPP